VDDSPVLICYDGSEGARNAITAAAPLLVSRTPVILTVDPTWRGVVGVADELGAAVTVLGSRGLTGVRELAEGSLSHEVPEHARRPVLVAPPNEPPLS
jgi:nucleotide-binding universal stress UspA family protein